MAMTLSPDYLTAWTASADRYIVQWQIGKIVSVVCFLDL